MLFCPQVQLWLCLFTSFSSSGSENKRQFQVKNLWFTSWWKNEAGRAEETRVWISKYIKTKTAFWHFSSIVIPLQGRQSMILFKWSNTSKNILIETIKEEIKSIGLEKNVFQNRYESILKNFKKLWDFQDSNARTGLEKNQKKSLHAKEVFWIRRCWEKWSLYWWRNLSLSIEVYYQHDQIGILGLTYSDAHRKSMTFKQSQKIFRLRLWSKKSRQPLPKTLRCKIEKVSSV